MVNELKIPTIIKPGHYYAMSWSNNRFLKWQLIDVTRNQATLKTKGGREITTNVNHLRVPLV